MTSRRNGLGLGVALSLVSFSLTLNAPVLAQDAPADEPPADGPAAEAEAAPPPAAEEPPLEPATEPPAAPEAPPTQEPALEPPQEPEAVPPVPPPPPTKTADSDASEEHGRAAMVLGLEQLPGSAYPAVYTRGIKYGSLWRTFHGQQWPYMPEIEAP